MLVYRQAVLLNRRVLLRNVPHLERSISPLGMAAHAHLDHNVETGPSWGSLALDSYMIDNWSSSSNVPDDEQRLQLVRKYLKAGSLGRKQYAEKAASGTANPTKAQIENILRPLRSSSLRSIANTLSSAPAGSTGPIWVRTDYQSEEQHLEFCRRELDCADLGEGLQEDSLILSDDRYYNIESWEKVLDFLPEIVVDHNQETRITETTYRGGVQRRNLEHEYANHGEDYILVRQQYWCVARFVIIEDRETHDSDPPRFHALWLDDCGNVVRENRILAEYANDYFVMANEGAGNEQEIFTEASIGPRYVAEAENGPPFSPCL